jgi:hypothetical protein
MANVITEQKIIDTQKRSLLKYVIRFDGTAAANTLLVNAANLAYSLNATGQIMTSNTNPKSIYRTTIKRIFGQGQFKSGYSVALGWQSDANSDIVTVGSGWFDYNFDPQGMSAAIPIPNNTTNRTGNIVISTVGSVAASDAVTIFIDLKKDNNDYSSGQTVDPAAFNWYDYQGNPKS